MRRLLAGDEEAFEEFSADYLPPLYRYALWRLDGDVDRTRDVLGSVVCKAIEKLSTFRGESALSTWLFACCRTEVAGHYRALQRRGIEAELPEERAVGDRFLAAAGPEEELLDKESAARVHLALDHLPPRYARALEWKYLEDLPVREIGARLGISAKAAESLLTRARQAFRAVHDGPRRPAFAARRPGRRVLAS